MPGTISVMPQEARMNAGLLASMRSFVLDLVFPPRCAGCGRVDTVWCDRCWAEMDILPLGVAVDVHPPLTNAIATGQHTGKLQQAIWALKYENTPALAEPLGERLAACFEQQNWIIDMIVPVPLHAKRLRERGYNQAQELGEHAAMLLSLPCISDALTRTRQTQSQVTLNAEQRQTNMEDAFLANPDRVHRKTLLLIDDVYTTGATLAACAQAALDAGANAVYGMTVTTPSSHWQTSGDYPV
jgi:competence protein ComFC